MNDCSQHKKDLFGHSDMKEVAEAIGDLHYETLAELIDQLSKKISLDGLKDETHGRVELAANLFMVAGHLAKAHVFASWAYEISKPFMKQ